MKVRAIDFVVSNVTDLDRAKRFYRDVLGIRDDIIFEQGNWLEFDTDPVALALRDADKGDDVPETAVALAVEDVKAAVEELREQGVDIVVEPGKSNVCTAAVIRDPDDNLLLLHRRHEGTAG